MSILSNRVVLGLTPGVVLASALIAALPSSASAQTECRDGRVERIVVESVDVFDVSQATEESPPPSLYRFANAIHMRTRESYIRGELLFEEGDCFEELMIAESERVLRSREIIKEASITSERLPSGGALVTVRTQDDWSLGISLGISFDEGLKFEGVGATEQNFLGRGITLGAIRTEDREAQELGGVLGATRFLGTAFQLSAGAGDTRVGPYFDQRLERPFLSEFQSFAIRQEVSFRDDYFAYSAPDLEGLKHVLLPYYRKNIGLTGMLRRGVPGGLVEFGVGVSRQVLRYPGGLGALATVNDDFDDPQPASDVERDEVEGQANALQATRINALIGFRRVSFVVRDRLDGIRAVQDVQVGSTGLLTIGRSVALFDDPEDANDLHARFDYFAGVAPDRFVLSGDAFIEGRRNFGGGADAGEWRDVMAQIDGRAYWQPARLPGHTFFARLKVAGAWSMDRPFQLTGGGREGVRGYSRDAFPGGRRALLTLEDRTVLLTRAAIDVGLALFADLGQVWAGDVPYGVDSGWRSSVGVGFRIGTPGGALSATRFDFTLPVTGDRSTKGVYFRFYTELGGLLKFVGGPGQVERSRWSGTDGDLTARPIG